jgi:hypothetical protein
VTVAALVRRLAALLDELEAATGREVADELRDARRALVRLTQALGL